MNERQFLKKRIAQLEREITRCQLHEKEQQAHILQLQQKNDELRSTNIELEHRYHDIALLSEMGDFIQCCLNVDEAYMVVARYGALLFPNQAGGIYLINPDPGRVGVAEKATWNDALFHESVFMPEECWALRRCRRHIVSPPYTGLRCGCLNTPEDYPYMCLPLLAQGKTLGVLHLCHLSKNISPRTHEHHIQIATMMAEHIALAFANIQLRQHLQEEVIHDPITGLYNRRYLVEVLEREIRQASQRSTPLCIMMIGIDQFKEFNDRYGQEAGNMLLQRLASLLRHVVTRNDLIYRYGGKEFVLMFPEMTLEQAYREARRLYSEAQRVQFHYQENILNGFSISLGIAGFPHHGETFNDIIHAANTALMQAQNTRDRPIVIGDLPPSFSNTNHAPPTIPLEIALP